MLNTPADKYQPYPVISLPDRRWPEQRITHAPRWLSTDLRDGNQALAEPMDSTRKLQFWDLLLSCGFKEIEVAFPSASQTDFNFVRQLIEENRIPDDVTIQVLTQAREDLIVRTFESLRGAKQATVHLYNATAPLFRRLVFGLEKAQIVELATRSTRLIRTLCEENPETRWQYEYSPETFCFTEPEFALEICEAVAEIWQPCTERPMVINLPATVEVSTPNVYADQIEYFCRHFSRRADCREIGPRQRIDKQRTRRHVAGDAKRVLRSCWQPDATARRNNPTARCGIHSYHPAQGVQQLGTVVLVPRLAVTMNVIMGKRNEGTMGKGEGRRCGHGLNNPHPTLSRWEREKVH